MTCWCCDFSWCHWQIFECVTESPENLSLKSIFKTLADDNTVQYISLVFETLLNANEDFLVYSINACYSIKCFLLKNLFDFAIEIWFRIWFRGLLYLRQVESKAIFLRYFIFYRRNDKNAVEAIEKTYYVHLANTKTAWQNFIENEMFWKTNRNWWRPTKAIH